MLTALSMMTDSGGNECKICGDAAIGYNYNVLSCNSCKSFFRRHANRSLEQLRCLYNDDCQMKASENGRRRCLKCRLKKCLEAGMKSELINSKEDTDSDDQNDSIYISCKLSRLNNDNPRTSKKELPEPVTTCEWELPLQPFHDESVMKQLDSSATVFDVFMDDGWHHDASLNIIIRESSNLHETDSLSANAEQGIEMLESTGQLTDKDQSLMTELEEASTIFFLPVQQKGKQEMDKLLGWSQYQTKEKLTRVIEFTKKLKAFQQLDTADQIALIKGGAWEMHIMRCILNYHPEEERFGPNRFGDYYNYPATCMYLARTISAQLNKKFLSTLDPLWCDNKPMVLLLIACILFDPHRSGLMDKNAVEHLQKEYHGVLFRFLLVQHHPSRSKARYSYNVCIRKMEELRALNRAKIDFLTEMKVQHGTRLYVEPLLQEVFSNQ